MAPALRPPDRVEPADGAVGRSIRHRRVALVGRSVSVTRCAAARPNTTMSSSELEPSRLMSIVASRIAKGCAGVDRHVDRDIQGRVVRSPSPA